MVEFCFWTVSEESGQSPPPSAARSKGGHLTACLTTSAARRHCSHQDATAAQRAATVPLSDMREPALQAPGHDPVTVLLALGKSPASGHVPDRLRQQLLI